MKNSNYEYSRGYLVVLKLEDNLNYWLVDSVSTTRNVATVFLTLSKGLYYICLYFQLSQQ